MSEGTFVYLVSRREAASSSSSALVNVPFRVLTPAATAVHQPSIEHPKQFMDRSDLFLLAKHGGSEALTSDMYCIASHCGALLHVKGAPLRDLMGDVTRGPRPIDEMSCVWDTVEVKADAAAPILRRYIFMGATCSRKQCWMPALDRISDHAWSYFKSGGQVAAVCPVCCKLLAAETTTVTCDPSVCGQHTYCSTACAERVRDYHTEKVALEALIDTKRRVCAQCEAPGLALMHCTRCRTTYYCNKECQHKHWAEHRLVCTPPSEGMDEVD